MPNTAQDTQCFTYRSLAYDDLRIETVSDYATFLSLEGAWNDLVDECGIDHPFLTFDWIKSWWVAFGRGKRLHILLVRDGSELIAIAPLMQSESWLFGFKLRSLEFISNVHTPRSDFVIAGHSDEIYRAIWDHLVEQSSSWDFLKLCQLPQESHTLRELRKLADRSNFLFGLWRSAESPYLSISGDWESYQKSLSGKHRYNIRSRLKNLRTLGEVDAQLVQSSDRLQDALEDGFQIEGAAWKDKEGTSIRSQSKVRNFYSTLAESLAQHNRLRLYFLTLNGKRIAFSYSVLYRNKLYLLKQGYDPQHKTCSPFNLLCSEFLKDAFSSGIEEFDFLGSEESWKLQWTQEKRSHYWAFIFPRRALTSLLYSLKFNWVPWLQQKQLYLTMRDAVLGRSQAQE